MATIVIFFSTLLTSIPFVFASILKFIVRGPNPGNSPLYIYMLALLVDVKLCHILLHVTGSLLAFVYFHGTWWRHCRTTCLIPNYNNNNNSI